MSVGIDFDAIESQVNGQVAGMTAEDLAAFVLKAKVRSKVQAARYNTPKNKAKEARKRVEVAAKQKAATETLKGLPATDGKGGSMYDQIVRQAGELAQAELAKA